MVQKVYNFLHQKLSDLQYIETNLCNIHTVLVNIMHISQKFGLHIRKLLLRWC